MALADKILEELTQIEGPDWVVNYSEPGSPYLKYKHSNVLIYVDHPFIKANVNTSTFCFKIPEKGISRAIYDCITQLDLHSVSTRVLQTFLSKLPE